MSSTAISPHPPASLDNLDSQMNPPFFAWKSGFFAPVQIQREKQHVSIISDPKPGVAFSFTELLDFATKRRPVVLFDDALEDDATAKLIACGIEHSFPVILGPKTKSKSPETAWAVKSAADQLGNRFVNLASSYDDIYRFYQIAQPCRYNSKSAPAPRQADPHPSTSAEGLQRLPGVYDATIGLYSNSGRLDANKISELFELSRRELAEIIGFSHQTLHANPDSKSIQNGLAPFENVARGLAIFKGDKKRFRTWLNSPCDPFEGKTPMEMIRRGGMDVVVSLVEAALTGSPF